jgi:hypothetical protein
MTTRSHSGEEGEEDDDSFDLTVSKCFKENFLRDPSPRSIPHLVRSTVGMEDVGSVGSVVVVVGGDSGDDGIVMGMVSMVARVEGEEGEKPDTNFIPVDSTVVGADDVLAIDSDSEEIESDKDPDSDDKSVASLLDNHTDGASHVTMLSLRWW